MHTDVDAAFLPLLWDYEAALGTGPLPDIRQFVSRCPAQSSPADLLVELLAVEFGHQPWNPERLRARLDSLSDMRASDARLHRLLHAIYVNRVASGERLTLASFDEFGASPEQLKLQLQGEPFFLGELLLNRYRIKERLGAGAFGAVYLADDASGNGIVAVKAALCSRRSSQSDQARKALQNEATLGIRLSHPNIVSAREFCVAENGHPFIVMDYVAGDSLKQVLRTRQLEPASAVHIAIQVADAIAAAYQARVTHRDLKPENVMIPPDGNARVTDFGLAIGQELQWWRDGEWAGTYAYMAPELLLGKTPELDVRADMWSLGVILYEMLTGHTPTNAASREEALVAAIGGAGRELDFPPSCPDLLRNICRRCLAYDPNMRYPSATMLAEDLRSFSGKTDTSEPRPEAVPSPPRAASIAVWRAGVKLGTAQLEHARSHTLLSAVLGHVATTQPPDREHTDAFFRAAAHEVAASQAMRECLAVSSQFECHPELIDHSAEFTTFLFRHKVPSHQELERLVALSAETESSLEQSFVNLSRNLGQTDRRLAALFKGGVYLSTCIGSSDARARLRQAFQEAGLARALADGFLTVLANDKAGKDSRAEQLRVDKEVERSLLADESTG